MEPSVCLIAAATPSLPLAPVPPGHLTVLSAPIDFDHDGLSSERNVVKPFVVPDSSERWTTVIFELGSLTPGLAVAIAGSFQVVILPWKMLARVGPSSLRPDFTPLMLYEAVIAPKNTGIWIGSPLVSVLTSSGVSAGSEPANCAVPCASAAMPAPEPTGWKFTVTPWFFSWEPNCW